MKATPRARVEHDPRIRLLRHGTRLGACLCRATAREEERQDGRHDREGQKDHRLPTEQEAQCDAPGHDPAGHQHLLTGC
jgi:hypothetical protein